MKSKDRCKFLVLLWIAATFFPLQELSAGQIDIIVSPQADAVEQLAARELADYLDKMYAQDNFIVNSTGTKPERSAIIIGSLKSSPDLGKRINVGHLNGPESYIVTTVRTDLGRCGIILGGESVGVLYAIYGLLETLGCGFYLSSDIIPDPTDSPFTFDGWDMTNRPLMNERIVFNWHNFLSGCSTWNLDDWKRWIAQSQKMGYNAVMVHAYGNNPMAGFTFNGIDKPLGYLSTTRKGRDWSTQHVNDVRRLRGGFVFDGPAFGADAAMVPNEQRGPAAQKLMHDVFEYAGGRGVKVYFALDVDTTSANPQEIIRTLPESARFRIGVQAMQWMNQDAGGMWLANPDTPEGYEYYKAQVRDTLKAYPHLGCLVVWFRHNATPWMAMKLEEMPLAWSQQYNREIEKTPEAAKLWRSHNFFAVARIVAAFEKACTELGRPDLEIAIGSWHFDFLDPADRFLPHHVKFIPLDWNVLRDKSQMRNAESRRLIARVAEHRPVFPVVWAHHDDGNYVGRPYTPYRNFYDRLVDARASGFGIIHWTTRPLDLYFKSLANQVQHATLNEPLRAMCERMALDYFGRKANETMTEYLLQWVTESPKIGRETSDYFIDRPLSDVSEIEPAYRRRLALLNQVETSTLTPAQRDRLDYFKGLERYIFDVHQIEQQLRKSRQFYADGDTVQAREILKDLSPGDIIEDYARFSSAGGITRGEQGLVASMNLRWLTHYIRHHQMICNEPVRYNFAPTSHDPLAQSMGTFTFHVDTDGGLWECFGVKETKADVSVFDDDQTITRSDDTPATLEEICRTHIEFDKPYTVTIQPIMAKGGRGGDKSNMLAPGRYRLDLLMLDPDSTEAGQRVFDINLQTNSTSDTCRFKPVRAAYLRLACHGNSGNDWNSIHEIRIDSLDHSGTAASSSVDGYPASAAVDGKAETRWAAQGRNHWIQFKLDPTRDTVRIEIDWYDADRRTPRFEILVSDDGQQWTLVEHRQSAGRTIRDRIDIFAQTQQRSRILKCGYDLTLASPGIIDLHLAPITGKATLCGLVLTPIFEEPVAANVPDVFSRDAIISLSHRINDYTRAHP